MIKHICAFPGCGIISDGRYCPAHLWTEAERKAANSGWEKSKAAHPERAAVYTDPRWRKLKAEYLKAHPTCAWCGERRAPGHTVDHIIPHKGDIDMALDPGNLQTLCASCNKVKTQRDRREAGK